MLLFILLLFILLLFIFFVRKSDFVNIVRLDNLKPNISKQEEEEGLVIYDNVSDEKYSPMFINPLNAKKISKTNSVHVVIPGILPASNRTWKEYNNKQTFYMPNDLKPHFHGEAQHHKADKGFAIKNVFLLSSKDFAVADKTLSKYRSKESIINFNKGLKNTAVETWIHWKIPYNQKPYPKLIVKKDSIIWWDFNNHHNLNLVSKQSYNSNKTDDDSILINQDDSELQVIVTIMDKIGKFYFLCSIPGHGELGHKIEIEVK